VNVNELAYTIYCWRISSKHWGYAERDYRCACYLIEHKLVKGNENRIELETILDENYG